MRYTDFKIVQTKLREAVQVYVIGDSHAKAMGGTNNLAANGARLSAIATQANRVPQGSDVYMTGGHNDVAGGAQPQAIAGQVKKIIDSLLAKDCEVFYVLFPEGSSNTNQEQMGPTRQAITTAVTVSQDLNGCSMQPDGIHCQMSSYTGIVNANAGNSKPAGDKQDRDNNMANMEGGLEAGPPYPQDQVEAVKQLQTELQRLGYSVGSTGIDGKYGPRTSRAVKAYQTDFGQASPPNANFAGGAITADGIKALKAAKPVDDPTPTGNNNRYSSEPLGDLADIANLDQAKEVVEEFLGTTITDNDMNMLVRATASEASRHNQERAAVAAVILNRVRLNHNNYGASIPAQLNATNQFQAVTGTRANGRQASDGYRNMTNRTAGEVIGTIIQNLSGQNKTWRNFTSNIPSAYGPGTDIGFMYTMRNSPNARVIGQTVFGTA